MTGINKIERGKKGSHSSQKIVPDHYRKTEGEASASKIAEKELAGNPCIFYTHTLFLNPTRTILLFKREHFLSLPDNHNTEMENSMESPDIRSILEQYHTIAVVGISPKPERPSNAVSRHMLAEGYTIVPINPGHQEILGLTSYPSLTLLPPEVKESIEIVNIFRKPADVEPVVDEAIAIGAKVIWTQLGIINDTAAKKARQAGLQVIQNRCISVEHQRLFL